MPYTANHNGLRWAREPYPKQLMYNFQRLEEEFVLEKRIRENKILP